MNVATGSEPIETVKRDAMSYLDARARRERARISQKELAAALAMSASSLRRYEQGKYPLPKWVTLEELFETINRLDWRRRRTTES